MARPAKRSRVASSLYGAAAGLALWLLALAAAHALDSLQRWFPNVVRAFEWVVVPVGTWCKVLAAPVSVGGWLLVWGDNGPPYPWMATAAFNIAFGIFFYSALGALLGVLLLRRRVGRDTLTARRDGAAG